MIKTNIILSGEGGQGIQTLTKIFCQSCFDSKYEVSYIPSFGVEQRGTPSVSFITLDNKAIHYPKFEVADYVIILQNRAIKAVANYISPNTKVIFDSSTISYKDLPKNSLRLFGIPATAIANEKFTPKDMNLLILGYLSKIFKLDDNLVIRNIENILGVKIKNIDLKEKAKDAFIYGGDIVAETDKFSKAIYKPKQTSIIFKGHGKTGEILPKRCKGCGVCIAKCPVGAISFGEELGIFATPVPKIDLEKCIACGNCKNFCPDAAICVQKENKSI